MSSNMNKVDRNGPRPQFNMHEYFLTALVSPLNVDRALRILQGYSAQRPHASVVRRVILEGPRLKNTKGIDQRWIQKQPSQKHPIWRALSDVLTKQAYLITLDYEVDASMFDAEAEGPIVDDLPGGIVKWYDTPLPDALLPVNARESIVISGNEPGLVSMFKSIGFTYKTELVVKNWRFIHGEVIFEMERLMPIPVTPSHPRGADGPTRSLPSYQTLELVSNDDLGASKSKWVLSVKVKVADGNDQDFIKIAVADLGTVKEELVEYFDLRKVDRFALDTKVKG